MALLIPPHGTTPVAIVLTHEEALTLLAILSANPSYANAPIRTILGEYIERVRES